MLKILQAGLQQYVNHELPDVPAGFRKGRGTTQNLWDALKAVLRGSLQQYKPISRNKRKQINNLILHINQLQKEEEEKQQQQQRKNKIRRKENIKIRAGINGNEMKESSKNQ